MSVLRDTPWEILKIPLWLSRGKAVLKMELARRARFDPATLPYNLEFLDWLREQKNCGRFLILCTASHVAIAEAIASHLDIFDEVLASDGVTNLAGASKAKLLLTRFGERGFDYAGNSKADLAVWRHARKAIVVNASNFIVQSAGKNSEIEKIVQPHAIRWKDWPRVLRAHQWLKNLLLFVPLIAGHQVADPERLGSMLLAFLSFSLCASSVYIANDLLDLESDRQHPRKRFRSFASGLFPIASGIALACGLIITSILLSRFVAGQFVTWLLFYFFLTSAYSFLLKRIMLVDCLTLAMLYTLRIVSGAAAAGMPLSFWLLAFSVFLFLSLAFVKRYAELEVLILSGKAKVHGRGYLTSDAPLVQSLGISSGYAAVVVLALYLNSEAVLKLYRAPEVVWGAVPVVLFWVSWMWLQAHRGNMHDDPLVFAVKDKASLLAGFAFGLVIAIGARGLTW